MTTINYIWPTKENSPFAGGDWQTLWFGAMFGGLRAAANLGAAAGGWRAERDKGLAQHRRVASRGESVAAEQSDRDEDAAL